MGSAAFVGGISRMVLSMTVIMLEATVRLVKIAWLPCQSIVLSCGIIV